MPHFDDAMKIAALERELRLRRIVYPGQVQRGSMSKQEADREIAIFEAILRDYRRDLFDEHSDRPKPREEI